MVHSTSEENQEDYPNDSIIAQTRLNISPPEEYSGSSDLKVYETFVTGILRWLRLHGLLGVKYTETQVQLLVPVGLFAHAIPHTLLTYHL